MPVTRPRTIPLRRMSLTSGYWSGRTFNPIFLGRTLGCERETVKQPRSDRHKSKQVAIAQFFAVSKLRRLPKSAEAILWHSAPRRTAGFHTIRRFNGVVSNDAFGQKHQFTATRIERPMSDLKRSATVAQNRSCSGNYGVSPFRRLTVRSHARGKSRPSGPPRSRRVIYTECASRT